MLDGPDAAPPRFLVDTMLGRLATWLRILGFDAAYVRQEDRARLDQAWREGRILLTRDARRASRGAPRPCLVIADAAVREQVRQVVRAFSLEIGRPPSRRCARCNLELTSRDRAAVSGRVPAHVFSQHREFWHCPGCGRLYWAGTHRQRMDAEIRGLVDSL
jgi:hypothetical protein